MQTVWIRRVYSPRIIVLALGWAGSDEVVRHLVIPEGFDVVCLFDYCTLPSQAERALLYSTLSTYGERHLIGWSFGVWAASEIFGGGHLLVWNSTVAVNGTPVPIDDDYGIPTRGFALTVRGIRGGGTLKFLQRMCGTPEVLQAYYLHRSTRPLDEICGELTALGNFAAGASVSERSSRFWSRAVVGGRDEIFPPENMLRYWALAGVPVTVLAEMPHYPFYNPNFLSDLLYEAR